MTKTFLAIMRTSLLSFGALGDDSYTVDSRHTFRSFDISHLVFSTHRGRFNETSGKIALDAVAGKGLVDIRFNAASISTCLSELEEDLRGKDFFDCSQYRLMAFKSHRLIFKDEQLSGVNGSLS